MHVYIIAAKPKLVKIGKANDPWGRLADLGTSSPHQLRLVAYWPHPRAGAVEKRVHEWLHAKRVNREWFAVAPKEAEEAIVKAIGDDSVPAIRPGKKGKPARMPYTSPPNLKDLRERYLDEVTAWIMERERRITAEMGEGAYKAMPKYQRDKWAERGMRDWPRPYPPAEFIL